MLSLGSAGFKNPIEPGKNTVSGVLKPIYWGQKGFDGGKTRFNRVNKPSLRERMSYKRIRYKLKNFLIWS